jgi:hypothetical protein
MGHIRTRHRSKIHAFNCLGGDAFKASSAQCCLIALDGVGNCLT